MTYINGSGQIWIWFRDTVIVVNGSVPVPSFAGGVQICRIWPEKDSDEHVTLRLSSCVHQYVIK